jgi:hypothetical protein
VLSSDKREEKNLFSTCKIVAATAAAAALAAAALAAASPPKTFSFAAAPAELSYADLAIVVNRY